MVPVELVPLSESLEFPELCLEMIVVAAEPV